MNMKSRLPLVFQPWSRTARAGPRSFWLQEALSEESDFEANLQQLRGSHRADVCIVGGGFTGLWTAIRLKEMEPSLAVTIVEAGLCGSGASGRNGGIVVGWWWKLPTLTELCGQENGRRLLRASLAAIDDIASVCERHGIKGAFRRAEWCWTATNRAQMGAWRRAVEQARALGLDEWVDAGRNQLEQSLGSAAHFGGVIDTTAGVAQPAKLARGLRRLALEMGVQIFERSPVLSVGGSPLVVRAEAGNMTTDQVVLAANAWMTHFAPFRDHVFTVSSDVIATEPLRERFAERDWRWTQSWSDSGLKVRYARTTDDGRIVFGRGGGTLAYKNRVTDEFEVSPTQTASLKQDFVRVFPGLATARITHAWAGPVDRSVVGVPAFGRLEADPRLVYAIGYSGTGVGPSAGGGRMLASTVLGRDDDASDMARLLTGIQRLSRLPPEPIRYIAGRVVQRAVERKEKAEDNGRIPSRAVSTLARLVPAPVETRS
jgi:glycine/D-amino acid oxidase-like deaminating enzyme